MTEYLALVLGFAITTILTILLKPASRFILNYFWPLEPEQPAISAAEVDEIYDETALSTYRTAYKRAISEYRNTAKRDFSDGQESTSSL